MDSAAPGLYVHLPWCVRKCPYCDFNSHALRADELPEAAYADALLADLDDEHQRLGGARAFASVFFGGGTPSLFSAATIDRLLERAHALFGIQDGAEITLEANPGTVEHGSFTALRAAGVNRISLGAQSFDNASLQRLGRIHSARETQAAVAQIRAAGFDDFNLDLMYGLPEQRVGAALADLRVAIELSPSHLSHYQLTLEPNTLFHHRPPPLPGEDDLARMHSECAAMLGAAGYDQYEVSAYARDGRRGRHNLNYWRFGDYIGVGAGSHGMWSTGPAGPIVRTHKARHPNAYMRGLAAGTSVREARTLSPGDLRFEYPLNRLRLKHEDLSAADFERRTAVAPAALEVPAGAAVRRGLLHQTEPGRWRKTALGWRFLNDLQALFLD